MKTYELSENPCQSDGRQCGLVCTKNLNAQDSIIMYSHRINMLLAYYSFPCGILKATRSSIAIHAFPKASIKAELASALPVRRKPCSSDYEEYETKAKIFCEVVEKSYEARSPT